MLKIPPTVSQHRKVALVAASALLMAAVVCSVYVTQGGDASSTIATLTDGVRSQAVLEKQLQNTQAQLAHEASIIASLRAKEVAFRTSELAAGKGTKGSVVHVKMQQLDGDEGAEEEGAEGDVDSARQKEELEKKEETHFTARQNALMNALTHEPEMKPSDSRHLKWKAAHEMYEQAAYKDISGEEHNRTEVEPEAEALTTQYGGELTISIARTHTRHCLSL